jgi:hypothetical protein
MNEQQPRQPEQEPVLLSAKRALFTQDLATLLTYMLCHGYRAGIGEVLRPPEVASLYAAEGVGICKSEHINGLAADLEIWDVAGRPMRDRLEWEKLGDWWKAMHRDNHWGGDFESRDYRHFERRG